MIVSKLVVAKHFAVYGYKLIYKVIIRSAWRIALSALLMNFSIFTNSS